MASKSQGQQSYLLIGNSRWHWAIQQSNGWQFIHTSPEPKGMKALGNCLEAWASVGPIPNDLQLDCNKQVKTKDVPLKNLPNWLGVDRAMGAWGALQKENEFGVNSNGVLIADAGTIFSLTRINENGEFAGGQLIPGLQLQLDAMARGAHQLPPISITNMTAEKFPTRTKDAMRRGILEAAIGVIVEAQKNCNLKIWLCGGDSTFIFQELQNRNINATHHPNLVLEGMVHLQTIKTG